ncbi:hypothetical protein M408DRAFT_23068 [Serendipita vermifera MAFF 305830]|uniref:C2H2-type domain-containing protein n=1 Tax=Serendipita vermifera MAFF 305830 TaxID=933852 RepID=A0A0C3AXM8_SERVB|nr:hypothetical protein M408DRAFT_23068 [Serendipita vermifera MAFF 305830]
MTDKCNWCNIIFEDVTSLRLHLKVDLDVHPYYCQKCKRSFAKLKALRDHFSYASKHRDESEMARMVDINAYCLHCRRQFATAEKLQSHYTIAHALCCEICYAVFSCQSGLQHHMASPVHNERNIPCPHCTRLFKTTSGVAHHMEATQLHKVIETVIQWDSDSQITDPIYTNRIQEVESEEDDDYVLVTRRTQVPYQVLDVQVNEDAWNEDAQAYLCPMDDCRRKFQKLRNLSQHLHSQLHHADPNTFHCLKCESRFALVSSLIQHLESGSCGLAELSVVKDIYVGLRDTFKRLLEF